MSRPALHALLNGLAATCLLLGWMAIRGWAMPRREGLHKGAMIAALLVSAVFLASYLDYHAAVGHVPFWGSGWLKVAYLAVLLPHIALAAIMVPPIVMLLLFALRGQLERHRRLARWTLPAWLYVSVTGVIVYILNHALRPTSG